MSFKSPKEKQQNNGLQKLHRNPKIEENKGWTHVAQKG